MGIELAPSVDFPHNDVREPSVFQDFEELVAIRAGQLLLFSHGAAPPVPGQAALINSSQKLVYVNRRKRFRRLSC